MMIGSDQMKLKVTNVGPSSSQLVRWSPNATQPVGCAIERADEQRATYGQSSETASCVLMSISTSESVLGCVLVEQCTHIRPM